MRFRPVPNPGTIDPLYTTDTSPEIYEMQLGLLRRMSPCERLRKSFSLSRQVKQMTMDAIHRRHPDFDEDAIRLKFIELTYGKSLSDDLRRWQKERMLG